MMGSVNEKYLLISECLRDWRAKETSEAAISSMRKQAPVWNKLVADGSHAFTEVVFPITLAADALVELVAAMEHEVLSVDEAKQLIAVYLDGGANQTGYTMEAAQLRMYVHLACQTVMGIMAEQIDPEEVAKSWRQNTCPACGSAAILAYNNEDGKRKLICGNCATHWRYKRIGCPACGEENHLNIEILRADNQPGWLVQVCRSCRGYIKVADIRELADVPDWTLANLATLPLDFAASKWLNENLK